MSNEKKEPIKVTWQGWLALIIMCCMFSGVFVKLKGPLAILNVLDLNTLTGSFGSIATGVNFMGKGGTGARDGFMFTLSLAPSCVLAMGLMEVIIKAGGMAACQVAFQPILKFILGIPGTTGLAFVNALNSSDIAAFLTKDLYENKMITDDERTIFVAYQYAGSAPIGNMISTQAPLLPIASLAMGPLILMVIFCKLVGANLVRFYLKTRSKKEVQ